MRPLTSGQKITKLTKQTTRTQKVTLSWPMHSCQTSCFLHTFSEQLFSKSNILSCKQIGLHEHATHTHTTNIPFLTSLHLQMPNCNWSINWSYYALHKQHFHTQPSWLLIAIGQLIESCTPNVLSQLTSICFFLSLSLGIKKFH